MDVYELYDWETKLNKKGDKDNGMNFNDVYIYSSKKSPKYKKRLCYVKDKIAVDDFLGDMFQLQLYERFWGFCKYFEIHY